jgi:hypothetical protein
VFFIIFRLYIIYFRDNLLQGSVTSALLEGSITHALQSGSSSDPLELLVLNMATEAYMNFNSYHTMR